ncbi:MAG: hypothetical protein VX000_15530, partial [Myxococcota bacterium]|nr:hypothetical protein [Myxococcota bacterium]
GLVGIDVSDPLEPTYLAAVAPFDWFRRAYKMHLGPYPALYGTHRDQGLVAYDRTDPSRPVERTWVRTTNLSGMAHTDDRLYVAGHSGYLHTYDISDPLAPVLLATTSGLGNGWVPLIRGDHLYVADNSLGVVVFDRSNPDAPRHLGQVGTAGGAQDLALSDDGSTLYAAVGGAGVEAFSLEDPASPASISRIDLSYSAIAVSADGDTLWAATQQDIVAIDIRDPRAPVLLNTDETRQWAMSVDADGGRAYVADWGFASVYAADLDAAAPDLDPSTTEVHVDAAGGTATLWLTNLGNDDLALLGATSSAQGLTAAVSAETVAPGSRAWMRVQWAGGGATLDAEICLATNDPDEPQQRISVRSGGSAGQHLGLAAPDFALRGLDGQVHRLSEQIGHPVVLVYFATW